MNVSGNTPQFGCCDFQLSTLDKSIICGRSMEFSIETESRINVHTRGELHSSIAPDKSTGVEWVTKYGYVAISALGVDEPLEGMNEKGLSFSFLSLQCSEYQQVAPNEMKQALGITDVGAWILGNFAAVEEVQDALKDVKIWGNFIDPITMSDLKLHIALHDSSGNNLVIEFLDGKIVDTLNPIGVLTNDPSFPWHIENLRRYNCLSAGKSSDRVINGHNIPSYEGSDSMLGLPGDWGSVSRFVRISIMMSVAVKVENALQGVNLAEHFLNNVDRPKGIAYLTVGENKLYETTRWATIKDLTHLDFYYRSYSDLALRVISLSKLDFSSGVVHNTMLVATGKPTVIDMTKDLIK